MPDDRPPAPGPLSSVDRAALDAVRAWGAGAADALLDRLPPARRSSLRYAREVETATDRDPAAALDRLRRAHAAQARPDLARVHLSWWARALRDETESVRRAVAAGLPPALADAVRAEFGLAPDDLAPDHPADPGASAHALALWSSRFVGDLSGRDDDPPVVAALTRFDAPTVARLIRTAGLGKWAITGTSPGALDGRDAVRLDHLRAALAGVDPRFARVAAGDVAGLGADGPAAASRAGLITVARLLNAAEPYRVRWALQHLPYPTAKALRTLMGPGGRKAPMLARWEGDVLRAAWDRLDAEGRLPAGGGAAP